MKKILATLALGLTLTSCQAQTEFSKESLAGKLTTTDNNDITFEEILKQNEGKVVVIEEVYEPEYFKDKRLMVSIFMSPINVHVTRYCVNGIVKYSKYHP